MNFLQKAVKRWQMRFSGAAAWAYSFLLMAGGKLNYRKAVGDGTGSSIVMAVVNWIARIFPEAPIRIAIIKSDGTKDVQLKHPMAKLLKRPNKFYSGAILWMATLLDWVTAGNAYWVKVRNGQGAVIQLWWVPQRLIEPWWDPSGIEFIGYYEYSPDGLPIRLLPSEVVHFRYGLDPQNPRKGLSPLASLLREIFTDEEAASFSASLLNNLGVPGVIISPDEDNVDITPDDMTAMKENFQASFSGDNRGKPMVMGARMKAQVLSFSPKDMELTALRRVPEERVTAVLGVPAIVVGLGAGLERSTFANFKEARETAYEENIVPTQRLFAEEIENQLLVDFEVLDGPDAKVTYEVFFDISEVRVLQEDENALTERVVKAVAGGVMRRSEARSKLRLPVDKRDEVYYLQSWIIEVGDGVPEPEVVDPAATATPLDNTGDGEGQKHLKADPSSLRRDPPAASQKWRGQMEKRIQKKVTTYLDSEYEKAAKAVEAAAKDENLERALDDGTKLAKLFDTFFPLLVRRAYKDADDTLEVGLDWALDNPYVQDVLDQLGLLIKQDIPETTINEIRELVGQQAAEGWSAEVLAERIRDLKEIKSPVRAKLIAITETARGYSLGSKAAYQDSGVVDEMEWLTFEPCPVCSGNHGKRVSINGGVFPSGHELPPAHPACRCAIAPIVKD